MLSTLFLLTLLRLGNAVVVKTLEEARAFVDVQMQNPLLWPTWEPIPYFIEQGAPEFWIQLGVNFWQTNTCLSFKREHSLLDDRSGLYFFNGSGCFSNVGRLGLDNPQAVSLGPGCLSFGTVTHEIGHAIGLHHEHARFDRDKYVTIDYERIPEGKQLSYAKFEKAAMDRRVPYGSIMHYSQSQEIIQTVDENYQETIGQNRGPSFNDIKKINLAYCDDICSKKLSCQYGGYADPKNCSKCLCPEGFEGDHCEKVNNRFEACGNSTLIATEKFQFIEAEGNITCYYLITGPPNKKIDFRVTEFIFNLFIHSANYMR